MPARLTSLDASFLDVESPRAHMHVGWVALFSAPADGPLPGFLELRDHVGKRLPRAPRYRQRLAEIPLRINVPVWIDDDRFDLDRHVLHAESGDLGSVVDEVMSRRLERDRPLWEIWIADRLDDGRIGVVGKAHHCMVDGIAAVELASLLLDPSPEPRDEGADGWLPTPRPGRLGLLAGAVRDLAGEGMHVAAAPARLARSPRRLLDLPDHGRRAAEALASSLVPAARGNGLNQEISPFRHLARTRRPLAELRQLKSRFGTTLNDVLLAAVAGGIRSFLRERGDTPEPLKAMVPVNLRLEGEAATLGNRIAFIFVELPCDEPDPVRRLRAVNVATSEAKRRGEPEGSDAVLRALGHTPYPLQATVSRLVASPRTFNLVVSNIPGPPGRLYMRGCALEEAYPIVPLADRHALSIGFTTIGDNGFFGLYADREALPDADALARDIDAAIEELLARG